MFFFFSSRRRHTRFDCDWSSDVCSSDLTDEAYDENGHRDKPLGHGYWPPNRCMQAASSEAAVRVRPPPPRLGGPATRYTRRRIPPPAYPMDAQFVLDPAYVSGRQFCPYGVQA